MKKFFLSKTFEKLFLVRQIKSRTGKLHFRRWRLLQTPVFALYVHQIFLSDEDKHCHNHPWNFASFILAGGYTEENPSGNRKTFNRFDLNIKRAAEYHKLTLARPTTSLVFTYGRAQAWGYCVDGKFVDNNTYRLFKNKISRFLNK